jgi:TRAP-type uncharacterized transport system substrate-binding protein
MFNNKYNNRRWIYGMIVGALITWLVMHNAHAQSLTVATGGPKGTYSAMFKELNQRCGLGEIKELNSLGSNDNIDKLVANQVNGAIVQMDVIFFRSKTEDLSKIKTLFSLHPEQVHFLARGDGVKEGGFMGIGGKEVKFQTISDLNGRNIGAAGGSVLTAKVVKAQAGVNYNVQEFNTNADALKALQDKTIDAVVIVGGQPMKEIEALPPIYKVLAIPAPLQDKLKSVYQPARVSYRNLNAAGVQTVSVSSLLVTREYKSAKFVTALKNYRECFYNNLDDLQETTGTSPAWQNVVKSDQGKWTWNDLK